VSILTIAFLAAAAISLAIAPILRRRANAGRRALTSAELDAAYQRGGHPPKWIYPPGPMRLFRASYLCVFVAWLALLGAYLLRRT
jgi:hypothetical protein